MTNRIINEGLDYLDMKGQLKPIVSVDEYSAKMGKDCDIVTLSFIANNEAVAKDLVEWFERGYDWILDASVSEGEITPGKYLVFVEMKRRIAVPEHIVDLLDDLETLTNLTVEDWVINIDDINYKADVEVIGQHIPNSPHQYRVENGNEEELNEMRKRAGLETKKLYGEPDSEIKAYIAMAGL